MSAVDVLLEPEECGMLFVDFPSERGFDVGVAYGRDDSARMIVS